MAVKKFNVRLLYNIVCMFILVPLFFVLSYACSMIKPQLGFVQQFHMSCFFSNCFPLALCYAVVFSCPCFSVSVRAALCLTMVFCGLRVWLCSIHSLFMMCFVFALCKAIVFCLLCVQRLCVSAAVLFTVYFTALLLLALCLAALLWPFSIYVKYNMLCV